jgi:hypothetical protein
MSRYREIKILATAFATKARARYRLATPDEEDVLSDEEAIVRANTLPFDRELDAAAITLACIELEPTEGAASRWIPRIDALDPNNKEDVELLATITARKAIINHEPVPYEFLEKIGEGGEWWDTSFDLIDAVLAPEVPVPEATYAMVFDRAVELLNAWSGDANGFWWRTTEPEPELPFDGDPPLTIISTEKDAPF